MQDFWHLSPMKRSSDYAQRRLRTSKLNRWRSLSKDEFFKFGWGTFKSASVPFPRTGILYQLLWDTDWTVNLKSLHAILTSSQSWELLFTGIGSKTLGKMFPSKRNNNEHLLFHKNPRQSQCDLGKKIGSCPQTLFQGGKSPNCKVMCLAQPWINSGGPGTTFS